MGKVMEVILAQVLVNNKHVHVLVSEGIRRLGNEALHALLAEFGQIHKHDTFNPKHAEGLPNTVKHEALRLITMIKEKWCGKIKAQAYANGRKQERYIKKSTATSPTIQLESLILSLMIDAREGRDVAITDIIGAYLLANMDDYILVKITGNEVGVMCRVSAA